MIPLRTMLWIALVAASVPGAAGPAFATGAPGLARNDSLALASDDEAAPATATDFERLLAEFEARETELRAATKLEEDSKRRSALRKERRELPALYWPKMEAVADTGDGRALLWMAENVKQAGVPKKERAATQRALYTRALANESDASWMLPAIETVAKSSRELGEDTVVELLTSYFEGQGPAHLRVEAAYQIATLYERSEEEGAADRAHAWFERLNSQFGDTPRGLEASDRLAGLAFLSIGSHAPEIVGEDLDGVAFKLSDYRGKVVVLDFWGDW